MRCEGAWSVWGTHLYTVDDILGSADLLLDVVELGLGCPQLLDSLLYRG